MLKPSGRKTHCYTEFFDQTRRGHHSGEGGQEPAIAQRSLLDIARAWPIREELGVLEYLRDAPDIGTVLVSIDV